MHSPWLVPVSIIPASRSLLPALCLHACSLCSRRWRSGGKCWHVVRTDHNDGHYSSRCLCLRACVDGLGSMSVHTSLSARCVLSSAQDEGMQVAQSTAQSCPPYTLRYRERTSKHRPAVLAVCKSSANTQVDDLKRQLSAVRPQGAHQHAAHNQGSAHTSPPATAAAVGAANARSSSQVRQAVLTGVMAVLHYSIG
jgi:hypothetical protein